MANQADREWLIDLAAQLIDAHDLGRPCEDLLSEFQKHVTYPNAADLFVTDDPPETIVDFAMQWQAYRRKVSREELLEVVRRLLRVEGTEVEDMLLLETFCENCVHPASADLIYYPDRYFNGNSQPTAEEIVQKAMQE